MIDSGCGSGSREISVRVNHSATVSDSKRKKITGGILNHFAFKSESRSQIFGNRSWIWQIFKKTGSREYSRIKKRDI